MFASAPPERVPAASPARADGRTQARLKQPGTSAWTIGIGVAYLAAHLPSLAPSLEDIDSINFALGLREFDPAAHQPHPPGSLVYIALGRLALAAVTAVSPALERTGAEALALALLSALCGALALVFAAGIFISLVGPAVPRADRVAVWAVLFLAASPLFWMTGLRPMSDMPGLAGALGAQALLLTGRLRTGALVAGLAAGLRAQTFWLTVPLLALALWNRRGPAAWRERAVVAGLAALGALAWFLPLVAATGGAHAYLAALGTQAGEDFAFVDMLWATPTARRLALGLIHTFRMPWASPPLAAVVLGLAAAGILLMLRRERRQLGLLIAAFAPYAVFHLVFQETVTVRYALPLLVPVALLAARALALAGPAMNLAAAPVAAVALLVAVPAGAAYGAEQHPAARAIFDMRRRADLVPPGMVSSHFELRRPLRAAAEDLRFVPAPRQQEWMELVRYWAGGGSDVAWFLANPRRTDLALIDPHSRTDVVRYRWAVESRPELSGTRPAAADWYRLRPPAWFLAEGWSLTPETGGVARATGRGPDHGPIAGYVRSHAGSGHLLIGGRHLGEAVHGPVDLELTLDGVLLDRWTVPPGEPSFLRFMDLPDGVPGPPGAYAALKVAVPSDGRAAPVAIRQFDAQPAHRVILGFGAGWHEDEYSADTGQRWRWASDRSVLGVRGPSQPLRLRIHGESPLRYFGEPPLVTVSANGRPIARYEPSADFVWDLTVPVDAMPGGSADVVIETSRTFVPAERGESADTRRLGLRVFGVEVASSR